MINTLKNKKILGTFFQGIGTYIIFGLINTFASVKVAEMIGDEKMSILYTIIYFLIVLLVVAAPRWYERTNIYYIAFVNLIMFALSLIGLGTGYFHLVIVGFAIYFLADFVQRYVTDVYIESYTGHESMGFVRGLYLALTNLVLIVATYASGRIFEKYDYSFISWFVGVVVVAMFIVLVRYMREHTIVEKTKLYICENVFRVLLDAFKNKKDIARVIILNAFLYIFYTLMWIYVPIYLKNEIGLSWSEIGLVISFALVPFVVIDTFAGDLADRFFGEKEMMITGVFVMGLSVIGIGWYTGSSLVIWGILMIVARIGAALYEIMTETYFFKKVESTDRTLIMLFRGITSVSRLGTVALASLVLLFAGIQELILIVGLLILSTIIITIRIKDTK